MGRDGTSHAATASGTGWDRKAAVAPGAGAPATMAHGPQGCGQGQGSGGRSEEEASPACTAPSAWFPTDP